MGLKSFSRSQYDAVAHPEKMDGGQLSRTRWALVVLGVVLVAGAVILAVLTNQPQGQKGAGPAPVPTISYSPSTDDTAGAGGCLDNTPKDITTTAPTVQQWVAQASGQVPVIKGAGPCGKPVSGVDTGFAKTQTGALSAAAHWFWELASGSVNSGTPEAIRAVTVAGSDRDALEVQAKRILSGAQSPGTDYRSITHLAGYRIQLQGDVALIDLGFVSQVGTDKINGTTRFTLRWESSDWKIVPVGPDDFAHGTKVSDLSQYVLFSAEASNAAR
ncbi:hypothetical protein [Sinomonas sp. ASV322]|uniref:hypothetical protein n=1 Tax=Sinomonas sp. ASV322 TaxID=3041920 RepID=UPI0027DC76E6|nr:hypothetical protein [Sinomonas sp. ASV322]MDQ4504453.1 hypothetical protein [Sinomonas sp. ASV322]